MTRDKEHESRPSGDGENRRKTAGRRGGPPRAIAALLGRAAGAALRKQGFAEASIVAEWATIVGPDLAAACIPEKLVRPRSGGETTRAGATLTVRCAHGPLATMLLHREPLIVERINGYFGFQAVARLKMVQGPLPLKPAPRKRAPRPLSEAERNRLEAALVDVADDDLRTALERLGRAVLAAKDEP